MTVLMVPTRTLNRTRLLLGLLADGGTDTEIAEQLGLSRKAFGTEVRRTLTALDVESRALGVALAYREGWLERIPSPRRGRPFAARQIEAVQLLVDGATEAQACVLMGLQTRGLRLYYTQATKHIGALSRPHLVRLCIDTGIAEIRRPA